MQTPNRVEKVNSLLQQEIGQVIRREIFFPNGAMVTVTDVQTAGNLFEAKVFISAYPESAEDEALKILQKSVACIQQQINEKLRMRPVPKIIFVKDTNIDQAGKVEALLHKLKEEGK